MGQKCNPNCLRLGFNKNWLSRWNYPDCKNAALWVLEDEKVRKLLERECKDGILAQIEIERFINLDGLWSLRVTLHMVEIGLYNHEEEKERLSRLIRRLTNKKWEIELLFLELKNPWVSAVVLSSEVSSQLESRIPIRVIMRRISKKAIYSGAKGIKIKISGRLNGSDMARSESYSRGEIPTSTLRADIEYSFRVAKTKYGVLGVKVWVNRGIYFGPYFTPMPEKIKIQKDETENYLISQNK